MCCRSQTEATQIFARNAQLEYVCLFSLRNNLDQTHPYSNTTVILAIVSITGYASRLSHDAKCQLTVTAETYKKDYLLTPTWPQPHIASARSHVLNAPDLHGPRGSLPGCNETDPC